MKREANMSDECSNCGKEITENSTFCRHFEDVYCSHACVLKALHARYTNCESECVCDLCGLPHYPSETIIVSDWFPDKSFCAESNCFDFSMGVDFMGGKDIETENQYE
jgi:hypothetical protein